MTGFNMPPGCSVSDIPGNSPEDARAEVLYDRIADILATAGMDPDGENTERAIEALAKLMGDVYREAYAEGVFDEGQANQARENDNV